MAESVQDILDGIAHARRHHLFETPAANFAGVPIIDSSNESELANLRRKITDKLNTYAISIDELIEQCETSAGAMQTILLELELAGKVKRSAGNKVYIVNSEDLETEEVA